MQPDTRVSLDDIVRSAQLIKTAIEGLSEDEFLDDWVIQSAVERQFMIIGEAMVRIRDHEPAVLDGIDRAKDIISFRNVLVHAYDTADPERVFTLSHEPLERLIQDAVRCLANG